MRQANILRLLVLVLLGLSLGGCATYYQPRYGSDGVYFDQARAQPRTVVVADPLIYPYWSLDYFYFSRFYHPYSVVVHHWDPWYYPYPGWYYGYRPGIRSRIAFSGGYYYPWYSFGFTYASYRPWRPYYTYPWYGRPHHWDHPGGRVQQIDERLKLMEQRQAASRTAMQTQPMPVRSETMIRHRIAEDRAAAASRDRAGTTRPAASPSPRATAPRPQSTRPATPRTEPRSVPSRTQGDRAPATREQRQPPAPRIPEATRTQRQREIER